MNASQPSVLLVGNFLSALGGRRGVGEELGYRLREKGWPVLSTSSKPGRAARLLDMATTCWCTRDRYDVAHVEVYSGNAFIWAETVCWSLRAAGRPYVLALHGGNLPVFACRWRRRVSRLLRSAVAVVAPSRYLLENMRSYREDIVTIPNALDLSAYPFRPRTNPAPRLVWVRSFDRIYNPQLAIRALERLTLRFPQIHLTMVGPDKGELAATKALAQQLGVSGQVSFPGGVRKSEIPAWLDRADIFLNTTNIDNTPVSVMEAMACGLCVVTTNVGGIPYLLQHERDALIVSPDSAEEMAGNVTRLLEDPVLAASISQNGRSVVEPFDWAAILPKWEALLISTAGAMKHERYAAAAL